MFKNDNKTNNYSQLSSKIRIKKNYYQISTRKMPISTSYFNKNKP